MTTSKQDHKRVHGGPESAITGPDKLPGYR